ncbi:phosphate ABC transporter substrate-binding protein PstS [Streptomyces sp. NPDC006733]|uniref:phosphate ABC transporter substrate-binding protein PstS n=1 Tax=Streptomyces sp. NPDC006733 TaxID=3155460 RepID=UPI003410DE1F
MKLFRNSGLRALTVGAVAVSSALVLTACGSDDNASADGTKTTGAAKSSIACAKSGQLLASGSSAQKNAMDVWVKNYMQACPGTNINYKSSSSGEGVTAFNQGGVSIAGSDSPLKPEEVTASKTICKGGQGIDLPMVGGPIAIGYHLPGVDNLVLDAPTLAKIFNSTITKWDDEAIKKLNPSAKLPSSNIQAFHRSTDSGTTDNLTKYFNATAKAEWPYEHAKAWKGKGGQSAPGSADIASNVKQAEGTIGYFELSFATANNLQTVKLATGATAPVAATSENASKAIAEAKVTGTGTDLALKLAYDTKAEGAYPLALVTYEIACDKGNKAETLELAKSFLTYIASEDGQKGLAAIGYAPLPTEIATKVRAQIATIS